MWPPEGAFGPDELHAIDLVVERVRKRIEIERPITDDEIVRIAHVAFEYAKLNVLDPSDLEAAVAAELLHRPL